MSRSFNLMSWELSWNRIKRVELSRFQIHFDWKELSWVPQVSRKKELSCEWVIVCLKIKELSWSMLSLEGMSWVELLTKSDVSELSWNELVEYQEWKRVELNSTHFIEKNWIELNLMKHWKRIEVSWVSIESSKE